MTTSISSVSRRQWLRAVAGAGMLVALSACSKSAEDFTGSDITGTSLGKGLSLVDHTGQPRTLADYAGKVVVVFFGYTQCPDVCPTSLADLAQAMQILGTDADKVQVLMVTVDPERDIPAVLAQYVTAFDARFVGLTGTPEQIKQAAASFKVAYAKVAGSDGDYSMDHTGAFFLLDSKGESRVLHSSKAGATALAHDLRLLMS